MTPWHNLKLWEKIITCIIVGIQVIIILFGIFGIIFLTVKYR